METQIKFYTGLDTIGALVMEVKYGKDRVFLEAGTAFNPAFDIFNGDVIKRKNNFIKDYLFTGEIPPIDGIYDEKYLQGSKLKSAQASDLNSAFFISHLHLDHMRMMGLIAHKIPVYLTKPAMLIEKALEDVNQGVDSLQPNYKELKEDTYVGKIKVHRFILNPDSYQDLSFLVETPDLKLHYTGDIFVWGKYFDNIKKEIKYLNKKDIDLIVHEGTTFSWLKQKTVEPTWTPKNLINKSQRDNKVIDIIKHHPSLVVFNYYEREMSDVQDLFLYEKQSKRTLVFEPLAAHIINKFFNKKVNIYIPDNLKDTKLIEKISKANKVVNKKQIIKNPKKYLVQTTYPNSLELLDYKDLKALYLHSSGSPIGSFDPAYANLMKIIEKANMQYVRSESFEDGTFFSQHATPEQLLQYLKEVNYKLAIPTHSENRKLMMKLNTKPSYFVKPNVSYIYDRKKNTLKEAKK